MHTKLQAAFILVLFLSETHIDSYFFYELNLLTQASYGFTIGSAAPVITDFICSNKQKQNPKKDKI
jgi:hypothetical protein